MIPTVRSCLNPCSAWSTLADNFGARPVLTIAVLSVTIKGLVAKALTSGQLPLYKDALLLDATTYQRLSMASALAWAMKPLIGVLSDRFPIFGYRKRGYMLLCAWLLIIAGCLLAFISLTLSPNLSLDALTTTASTNTPHKVAAGKDHRGGHNGGLWATATALLLSLGTSSIAVVAAGCMFIALGAAAALDLLTEGRYSAMIQANPADGGQLVSWAWWWGTVGGAAAAMVVGPLADAKATPLIFALAIPCAAVLLVPLHRNWLKEPTAAEEDAAPIHPQEKEHPSDAKITTAVDVHDGRSKGTPPLTPPMAPRTPPPRSPPGMRSHTERTPLLPAAVPVLRRASESISMLSPDEAMESIRGSSYRGSAATSENDHSDDDDELEEVEEGDEHDGDGALSVDSGPPAARGADSDQEGPVQDAASDSGVVTYRTFTTAAFPLPPRTRYGERRQRTAVSGARGPRGRKTTSHRIAPALGFCGTIKERCVVAWIGLEDLLGLRTDPRAAMSRYAVCVAIGAVALALVAAAGPTPVQLAIAATLITGPLCIAAFAALPYLIAAANVFMFLREVVYVHLPGPLDFFYTAGPECIADGPHFTYTFYQTMMPLLGYGAALGGILIFSKLTTPAENDRGSNEGDGGRGDGASIGQSADREGQQFHNGRHRHCARRRVAGQQTFRSLFYITTTFKILASFLDVCITARWNRTVLGISDTAAYIFGDAVVWHACQTLDYMPAALLMARLCPRGLEATAFSLLAGYANLGSGVARAYGLVMTEMFEVKTGAVCDFTNLSSLVFVGHCVIPLLTFPLARLLIPAGDDSIGAASETTHFLPRHADDDDEA